MGHFGGICFEMNDCDIEVTNTSEEKYLYLCKVSSDIRNSNSNLFLETYYVEDISNLRRPRRICGNKVA